MKKIFLGLIAIALMSAPTFANGGKKETKKKKDKFECKKDCCDKSCSKDRKCDSAPYCTGSK
jgi:hypothetical protein